jgi:hypothetical protein
MGGTFLGVWALPLLPVKELYPLDLDDLLPKGAQVVKLLRADDGGESLDVVVRLRTRHVIGSVDLVRGNFIERDQLATPFF